MYRVLGRMPFLDLMAEFSRDHTQYSQGVTSIGNAIDEGQVEEARRITQEVDRLLGAHIKFVEVGVSPILAQSTGQAGVDKLSQEHGQMAKALRDLQALLGTSTLGAGEQAKAKEHLGVLSAYGDNYEACSAALKALHPEKRSAVLTELKKARAEAQPLSQWKR